MRKMSVWSVVQPLRQKLMACLTQQDSAHADCIIKNNIPLMLELSECPQCLTHISHINSLWPASLPQKNLTSSATCRTRDGVHTGSVALGR